jgi:16S rRNA (cytosine1402-N4)-methyltransferase
MHKPVMLEETIAGLNVQPGGRYVDATVGDGGHACEILRRAMPDGALLALDRDQEALSQAQQRLAEWKTSTFFAHAPFSAMEQHVRALGWTDVDGVLFDLGVRSYQLDTPARGFSFMRSGPLDMRMDATQGPTAADLVNTLPEQDLAALIYKLGEEPGSRRIARAIVAARETKPFETTGELAAVVEQCLGGRRAKIHPATRTFMALRMAVNRELEEIAGGLEAALALLRPGGRMAVITFHSVEDREVKRRLRAHEGKNESLQAGGSVWRGAMPRVRRVLRKALAASKEEARANPRARSAKLRVVERIEYEAA